uniref:Ig-like domain-containing protein n=1 Tax=Sphaeramia orbicularis TaxID=375764 RepID=A0A672Y9L7_9TELE
GFWTVRILIFMLQNFLLGEMLMESIPSSSVVKRPGETLSLSCRGSGFTFWCCGMSWIRQPEGKGLEWIGVGHNPASSNSYASSVQGRIEVSRDDSNSMVHLRLSNLKPEDSAVYYCLNKNSSVPEHVLHESTRGGALTPLMSLKSTSTCDSVALPISLGSDRHLEKDWSGSLTSVVAVVAFTIPSQSKAVSPSPETTAEIRCICR